MKKQIPMNLSQRIAALPPERFAKSAYLSADLAIKAAIRAGKEPPKSALFIKSQTPEQLMKQQRKRLALNNKQQAYIDGVDYNYVASINSPIAMRAYIQSFSAGLLEVNSEPDPTFIVWKKAVSDNSGWGGDPLVTETSFESAKSFLQQIVIDNIEDIEDYYVGDYASSSEYVWTVRES